MITRRKAGVSETKARAQARGELIKDPGKLIDPVKAPYEQDIAAGHDGRAAGRAVFDILTVVGTAATTAEAVRRILRQLAAWTGEFAGELLEDGDELFDRLSEDNAARGQAEQDEQRARRLRKRADDAWRRKDFATVVTAYGEIDRELRTVQLRASERGRLSYALRALPDPGDR